MSLDGIPMVESSNLCAESCDILSLHLTLSLIRCAHSYDLYERAERAIRKSPSKKLNVKTL